MLLTIDVGNTLTDLGIFEGEKLISTYKTKSDPDKSYEEYQAIVALYLQTHGAITALYAGDQLIGVNFFDFSKIVKLHTEGMIVTPEDKLIDVINAELENAKLPRLPYTRDSGYHVGKIVSLEEHPLDEKAQIVHLDFGAGKVLETTSHYPNLNVGELLVCALDGTITFDGTRFNAGKIRNIGHGTDWTEFSL